MIVQPQKASKILTIEDDIDDVLENSKTEELKQSHIFDYVTDDNAKKMIESKHTASKSLIKRKVRRA